MMEDPGRINVHLAQIYHRRWYSIIGDVNMSVGTSCD